MKKDYLYRIFGGLMILTFLGLTFFEYERVLSPIPDFVAKERYIDYSILLYSSSWIIYVLLFLAGILTFFKSKKASLFLLIFSLSALLEIYINETFYIVKSIGGIPKYILLSISIVSLIGVSLKLFKTKRINLSSVVLSIILAVMLVYLPNTLITFYF
jgi:hypothetical protein